MADMAGNTAGDTQARRRLDLKAAAAELGVTSEAIRRRAKRGTLPSEKGEDGLLYVWVPDRVHGGVHGVPDGGAHGVSDAEDSRKPDALLERYENENDFLRRELERLHRELERKDAILLTLAQRVPELEPASTTTAEVTGAPVTPSENGNEDRAQPSDTGAQKPSWWRRFFGFE